MKSNLTGPRRLTLEPAFDGVQHHRSKVIEIVALRENAESVANGGVTSSVLVFFHNKYGFVDVHHVAPLSHHFTQQYIIVAGRFHAGPVIEMASFSYNSPP